MQHELTDKEKFDLNRFISAQEDNYSDAVSELKSGRKRSHWMWYVFPQFEGLGHSSTSARYAIKSIDEARAYLQHPILGLRLKECSEAVLAIEGKTASEIFGYPDDLKLKSSMTLFEQVAENDSCFTRILDNYFDGKRDSRTLDLLKNSG